MEALDGSKDPALVSITVEANATTNVLSGCRVIKGLDVKQQVGGWVEQPAADIQDCAWGIGANAHPYIGGVGCEGVAGAGGVLDVEGLGGVSGILEESTAVAAGKAGNGGQGVETASRS